MQIPNRGKSWLDQVKSGYDAQTTALGFNSGMESRDSWKPKTVDDLRAANNPKAVYRLDNHMGPAAAPKLQFINRR